MPTRRLLLQILSSIVILTMLFSGFSVPSASAQEEGHPKRQVNARRYETSTGVIWYVATTGDDSNSCSTIGSPCATINGAIGKANDGDTIKIALGTYTGTDIEVVLINKSITLSSGWDIGFTTQTGQSILDAQSARRGVTVNTGVTATMERFVMQNGNQATGSGIANGGY